MKHDKVEEYITHPYSAPTFETELTP